MTASITTGLGKMMVSNLRQGAYERIHGGNHFPENKLQGIGRRICMILKIIITIRMMDIRNGGSRRRWS